MAQPLKHDDWRILARAIKWLLRVQVTLLDEEEYDEFRNVRNQLCDFALNLRELTKDLPKDESSDEESDMEATEEGVSSDSDEEEMLT